MRVPVDGSVHVHYGQLYVESEPDGYGPDLHDAFRGQDAGLCGAAVPGALWLTTGLHTGHVGFRAEVHDRRPDLDVAWEEIVEVPFTPVSGRSLLVQWSWEAVWELGLAQTGYRVRYSASGMDAARQADTRLNRDPELDRYLLQFWPDTAQSAQILKQTSQAAAYWHEFARTLPQG